MNGAKVQVSIRFFTSLREITQKREEILTFADNERVTIDSVLRTLSRKYGEDFIGYVYDSSSRQPRGSLQFLVNGASTSTLNGLKTELMDGDVLAILPPVGGG